MKGIRRIFSQLICIQLLFVLAATGVAGAEAASDWSNEGWYAELEAQYQELLPDLGVRAGEWEDEMNSCSPLEQLIMKYYFIRMPMSDVCSLDYALVHKFASHAAMLRETMSWTAALDDETFLCYVANYLVDREDVVDYRGFFYDELKPLIEGCTLAEAALRVNLWCGQQATYGDSDQRVASPLGIYNGGYGRCGEEANFAVNALRSVGIPARLCGTTWTIVTGNHAFAEVLVDGAWHYMGACEPDAKLDVAWFTSRLGSLLTTEIYNVGFVGASDAAMRMGDYCIENSVASYTSVKSLAVTVLDESGAPAADCQAELLFPQSDCYPCVVASNKTDAEGRAEFEMGLGACGVLVRLNGAFRFGWTTPEQTEITLDFSSPVDDGAWLTLPIAFSSEETALYNNVTDEERAAFFGGIDVGAVRDANRTSAYDPEIAALYPDCEASLVAAGRNFAALSDFLMRDDDPMRAALVANLTDKDCREITAEILDDLLKGAESVRGELRDEDFIQGLLLPVFDYTAVSPHRLAVQQFFTADELDAFRGEPSSLYEWYEAHVTDACVRDIKGVTPDLTAVLKTGYCPESWQSTSLMQLARAVGIPVKEQESEDGSALWVYLVGGEWRSVSEWAGESASGEPKGTISYINAGAENFEGLLWLLTRVTDGDFEYYMYWQVDADDSDTSFDLPAGNYIIWMVDMADDRNGTLYANCFTLEAGETMELAAPAL